MKYLFSLTVLSLLVSSLSNAQSNYKPGYVVNTQNDTLKGFIDYREWNKNPKEFNFKKNLNDRQSKKFTVDNAKAFDVDGVESFKKFIFNKSNSQTDINRLTGLDTTRSLDTAFLSVITKGKNVTLYSFTDKVKTRFYVISKQDAQPKELDYYVYDVKSDELDSKFDAPNTVKLYPFRSQLQELADILKINNPKLTSKIKYASYNGSDIRTIVNLINENFAHDTKRDNLLGARFFAGAAIRSSQLKTGGGATFFPDGTNVTNVAPVLSFGIDNLINKYTQKLILRTEIELSNNHYNIPPTVINGVGTTASLDFKQYTASLIPQLIYNLYSTNELKIFIDAGISLNFSSYSKHYYLMNFNNVSSIRKENFPDFEKFWTAPHVKAGFVIGNKIEIYASHSFSSPISQIQAAPATVSYNQAGINYLF
jgi:hypothetical protein